MNKFKHIELTEKQLFKDTKIEDIQKVKKNIPVKLSQLSAFQALEMGLSIKKSGYNIFVMGNNGIRKDKLVLSFLETYKNSPVTLYDYVYVNNFEESNKPVYLMFEIGKAKKFKKDMEKLLETLRGIIPACFNSALYLSKIKQLKEKYSLKQRKYLDKFDDLAKKKGLYIDKTSEGFTIQVLQDDNTPMKPEIFESLEGAAKKKIISNIKSIQGKLEKFVLNLPLIEQEHRAKTTELNNKMVSKAIMPSINKLIKEWHQHEGVAKYLTELAEYVLENYNMFITGERNNLMAAMTSPKEMALLELSKNKFFQQFGVNILVSRRKDKKSNLEVPIIYADHPNYQGLFGKIEYTSEMGVLQTDFNNIKAGALHNANGGFLVINARKLLQNPWLWESLKHTLKESSIAFNNHENYTYGNPLITLDPQPIPLNIKIILEGEAFIYHQLWEYDPEFKELFKIVSEFDDSIPYDSVGINLYVQQIKQIAHNEKVKITDKAIAAVINIGGALVASQEKLSTNVARLTNVILEANHLAIAENKKEIKSSHILKAHELQKERMSNFYQDMQKYITNNLIRIQTEGDSVGEINGLSVYKVTDFLFGQPQRISCTSYAGTNSLINIEKSVRLSGAIHSKGILILQSFLYSLFPANKTLSFSANIAFEQSYGPIDGDSATCAELYCLLSALSGVPLKQHFAITGSMDQKGRVQAIGGVNEKIEGFFNICKQKGLNKKHGVIIPKTNMQDLMLPIAIREAVKNGDFHIYAIEHINEGIELLTGLPIGIPNDDGTYPESTIAGLIEQKWVKDVKR